MIIVCASCSIRYAIDIKRLVPSGKTVRCSNCNYKWVQAPAEQVRQPAEQPQYAPSPQSSPQTVPVPPAPEPEPELDSEPESVPGPEKIIDLEPIPEPKMDPIPALKQVLEPEKTTTPEPKPEENLGPEEDLEQEEEISQERLDSMLGSEDDPEPIESMVNGNNGYIDDKEIDPDEIPDPDPLPQSLTGPAMQLEDDYSMGLGKKIGIGVAILFFIILGGLIFAKKQIIAMVPATAPVYLALAPMLGMLSFSSQDIGEGLVLKDIKYEPEAVDGKDFLTVKGRITNTLDKRRSLPSISITLGDAEGNPITSIEVLLKKQFLRPNETIAFTSKKFKKPAIARKVNIDFIKLKAKDGRNKDKAK
jgi:predicted Zn finger-like uncharacterized protein